MIATYSPQGRHMTLRDLLLPALYVTALIVGLILFLGFADKRDAAIERAADAYDACMQTTYGMSPDAFNALHGYFPVCER